MANGNLDFSDLGAKPVMQTGQSTASIDFSDLGAKRVGTQTSSAGANPSLWDRVSAGYDPGAAEFDQKHPIAGKAVRYFSSIGGSLLGAPNAVYHAFADEPTDEERQRYADMERQQGEATGTETSGLKRIGLGLDRLITRPVANAADDYAAGKVTWEARNRFCPSR